MVTQLMFVALTATGLSFNPNSGLDVGQGVTPFHPQHVTGPHKGTDACPP